MADTIADKVAGRFLGDPIAGTGEDPGTGSGLGSLVLEAIAAGDGEALEAAIEAICEKMKGSY